MLAAALNTLIGGGQRANPLLFHAPLTTSLVPTKGVGPEPFTRNSTATVADHEGIIRTCKANEARFYGARRVENLFGGNSEVVIDDNVNWDQIDSVEHGIDDPLGGNNASRITELSSAQNFFLATLNGSGYTAPGKVTIVSVWIRLPPSQSPGNFVFVLNRNGGDFENSNAVIPLTHEWQRFSLRKEWLLPGHTGCYASVSTGGTGATQLDVFGLQYEDATGQENQNPSEYVSVGVLSAPYHGVNVDGVKCFDYANGNTVDANGVVTEARGAALTTCKGYYYESQVTNRAIWSSDFSQAAWAGPLVPTGNSHLVPDGTYSTTCELREADTLVVQEKYLSGFTRAASTVYTESVYVKRGAGARQLVMTSVGSAYGGGNAGISVDFDTGVVTSATPGEFVAYGAEPAPFGYMRIWFARQTGTPTTSSGTRFYIHNGTTSNYQGDGASSLLLWGYQIEAGNRPTSLIQTAGTAQTRSADRHHYPSSIMPDTGSVVCTVAPEVIPVGTGAQFFADDLVTPNVFQLRWDQNNGHNLGGYSDSAWVSTPTYAVLARGVENKLGFRWDGSASRGFLDGVALAPQLSPTPPWGGGFGVGNRYNNVSVMSGWIRDLRIYKKPLPDAKMQEMTS